MITTRYRAPHAEAIFSPEARANRMRHISDMYLTQMLLRDGHAPYPQAVRVVRDAPDVMVFEWEKAEAHHGHEIVGFLGAYMDRLPSELHWMVHYGLTSSDLVEYDLHQSIREHTSALLRDLRNFQALLVRLGSEHAGTRRAGRTHGQLAAATTLGHQIDVFRATLVRIHEDLTWAISANPVKSSGPVGLGPRVAPIGAGRPVPSTQIVPRDFLLRWASSYLALSNLLETMAMFVRTGARSEVGEFKEGASEGRVGSSAMPGKTNPIQSERICGHARIARGNFLALAEVSALWDDRDLSNSSTERVVVPSLAATVEYMLSQTSEVWHDLVIDVDRIQYNAQDPRCTVHLEQMKLQRTRKIGPIEASRLVKEGTNTNG